MTTADREATLEDPFAEWEMPCMLFLASSDGDPPAITYSPHTTRGGEKHLIQRHPSQTFSTQSPLSSILSTQRHLSPTYAAQSSALHFYPAGRSRGNPLLAILARPLDRVPSRLVFSGTILCLLGKAHALDNDNAGRQDGCWHTIVQYLFAISVLGTAFHDCPWKECLPYFMSALSLSWPITKTDPRSPMPLIYAVYLAHLGSTGAYGFISFRGHYDPRRPWFLSVLLCATTSLTILLWSPTGLESLLTFFPPVLSLSLFVIANASLIADMLRGTVEGLWRLVCDLIFSCLDCLGGCILSIGRLLRRPAVGRHGDEENLFTVGYG